MFLIDMTVISMLKFVPVLKRSNIYTNTYIKAMIAQLWVFELIRKEMRSQNIWMVDTLDQLKAVGIYLNFQCMQNLQQSIDFLSIWRISTWCTLIQMTTSIMSWKEVLPRTLLLLLGSKSINPILMQG